ncbi:ubiquitin fusion degradation protein [Thraustotheca clavata]|uniref:Ubiquitin fusion degradation protein n=1 Tax=Thraustotheca clavata TaxID=74557 RepID=A0A1V9Y8S5_9STRA|nr:ubiquitin fusion degradation protein [Thraustotheca clavata]
MLLKRSAFQPRRWLSVDAKKRKVKAALVSGYLGTGFHGVQLQEHNNVPTIEQELRNALFAAGCISESNYADMAKIGWSRSSRTDKGVHASCIVFSAKLLVDEDSIDESTGRLIGLPEALNKHLPDTIRMFTATKVHRSFRAREDCLLREYEYFLPLSFLEPFATPTNSVQDMAAKIIATLPKYEGIFDFHNFTKQRGSFYKQKDRKQSKKEAALSDDDEVAESEEDFNDNYDVNPDVSIENGTRRALQRHRRTIYRCQGSLIEDFHGASYIRIHLTGASFLLNQIRCMVGAAIAVATGHLTPMLFEAALETNQIVRVPTAPAEGLVLASCSLSGKRPLISFTKDYNTPNAVEMKKYEAPHRILLDPNEYSLVFEFRNNVIYKEVARAWNESELVANWPTAFATWKQRFLEEQVDMDALQKAVDALHVHKKEKFAASTAIVRQARMEKDHVKLLPRAFATSLSIRFQLLPGNYVADIVVALKECLMNGVIPVNASEEDLYKFVQDTGLDKLAARGQRIRMRQ